MGSPSNPALEGFSMNDVETLCLYLSRKSSTRASTWQQTDAYQSYRDKSPQQGYIVPEPLWRNGLGIG